MIRFLNILAAAALGLDARLVALAALPERQAGKGGRRR